MASSTSYNTAGNREDLTDIISILEPESTPFVSMMKKGRATGTFVEWQADKLSTPDFDGVNEGEDVSSFKNQAEDRARLGNYVQKFRDTFQVSDIQELVDTAGVANEFANAEAKAVRNVKRSIESAFCSSQDRQAEAGSGTPYKTRGMLKWLGVGGQPSDIPAAYQNVANDTTGTQTEATFNSVLQELYEANGMPGGQLTLIAGPSLKQEISNFSRQASATNNTYVINQDAESRKITLTVNLYEGDFGTVACVPSLFINRTSGSDTVDADAGLLIDPEYVGMHSLKAESATELEDQGGGRRGFVDVIASLACYSPKAHGYFN
tara:strand:- start:1214 stop:2179 length:966 start_codon:yes stop_codon:yes gene_type:complete